MSKSVNLHNSYFALVNPFTRLVRWTRRYPYQSQVVLNGRQLSIKWTESAHREFQDREQALTVEMQLYFSCVVKKRVLFHDGVGFETVRVDDTFHIGFRCVQPAVCSPEEFTTNFPEKRELKSTSAQMTPASLRLDFRHGQWAGEFGYDR